MRQQAEGQQEQAKGLQTTNYKLTGPTGTTGTLRAEPIGFCLHGFRH